ncbi:extracellular solute-binding protein [Cohnella zeiphila]|uniref:ABC transporter substrate-binding protein n=1 Tax=Cohnella zeiphila TaxID=2761120 RepID=A0A7X0SQC8_9BACL|nr:ABC transporter substrate-binding protein [Cohnella zeiphila]
MVKTKKAGTLLLASALTVALAACSGGNNNGGNSASGSATAPASGASSASASADAGKPDTSKFVTVNYVILGDKPKNGQFEKVLAKVNELLKAKVNAQIEWKWVEWADWQTKYNLLLASGEQLDLITVGTDWLDTWSNAQRGAFLPLSDDMLKTYAPQTYANVKPEEWAQTKYDGKVVILPENQFTQWVNHGFIYRGDWAKEAGLPDKLTSWDEIEKYLQYIKDNKPDVVPFDVAAGGSLNMIWDGWDQSFTKNLPLPVTSGFLPMFYAKSYDEPYTAVSPIFDDTFMNYVKKMKEWADKGFWREDVLNNKVDITTQLEAGLTGLMSHHTSQFSGLRPTMDKKQPGSDLQFFPFARPNQNLMATSITHGGTSIGAHSKNPERALMVYDLLRNDKEIYDLINYGIEGTQYEIKDNKRVLPAGYDETRDAFYSDFWGGRNDKLEIPSDQTWDKIDTLYQEYDSYKKPYIYGQFVFDKSKVQAELAAISQVSSQMGPSLSFGQMKDPEKAVQDFRDKLKQAGYDKVMAELQRQLDDYKKLIESQQ